MTTLRSADETFEWGRQLAGGLRAGDVIALCGNLGAGKTQATKGIVAGLGAVADVTSPTFTLVHEYGGGSLPVFHFDFYRMESEDEVVSLGWDEYLDEPGVVIVEWADRFPRLMPKNTRWFRLANVSENARTVQEASPPAWSAGAETPL
ncbi:MAG: tRNA (adenosine(37)-N6)-threonylcarbamoyltransferase complex ATPase subunit type 1 TsaE [Verrucomicrobiaceae bacterium]|nr:tRNA (adenosine(37)-N6)-threonylcarbamoyltransferase complex ATPase subunit type 1 TsaE [Verrucomicrobiaceae bacterium]